MTPHHRSADANRRSVVYFVARLVVLRCATPGESDTWRPRSASAADRRRHRSPAENGPPRRPAGHAALDRDASPNTSPAPHARPSAPCCLDEVTLMTGPRNLSLRAATSARWSFCRFSPASSRHTPATTTTGVVLGTSPGRHDSDRSPGTTASARWPRGTRSLTGTRYLPSSTRSPTGFPLTGLGDGRGHHDRWLEFAVTGNMRIFELPEYISVLLWSESSDEVHVSGPSLRSSRSRPAVKLRAGSTGPSEASREAAS